MSSPGFLEWTAAACLLLGLLHALFAGLLRRVAARFAADSPGHTLLLLLSEVEVAFMLWAAVFLAVMAGAAGGGTAVSFIDRLDLTEPVYVFVVLVVAAVQPVVSVCDAAIARAAGVLPLPERVAFVIAALTVGPLLGSLVTEPAAMAITAVLLERRVFRDPGIPDRVRYGLLGVLFVNVSIGGTLTTFAAPPVVMVARAFDWDTAHVLSTLGWKAAVAVTANAVAAGLAF